MDGTKKFKVINSPLGYGLLQKYLDICYNWGVISGLLLNIDKYQSILLF